MATQTYIRSDDDLHLRNRPTTSNIVRNKKGVQLCEAWYKISSLPPKGHSKPKALAATLKTRRRPPHLRAKANGLLGDSTGQSSIACVPEPHCF